MNHILTIAEAAERMNVSRQRMHKLIESYELQTQKIQGRLLVMDEDELKKIPKVRKNNSAAKPLPVKLDRMIATKTDNDTTLQTIDSIASLIEQACQNGDSVSDIARRANVTRPIVSAIRNKSYASSPSLENFEKILKALGFKLTIQPD